MKHTPATITARYGSKIGCVFGMLTLVGIAEKRGDGGRLYGAFRCDCGVTVERQISRVINGKAVRHCGCRRDRGAHRRHGMRDSVEYSSWRAMKDRCLRPTSKDYPRWGARGITVHPAWVGSFEAFYEHIGPRPDGTTLDRIDTTKGYEPGNVRWATPVEQACNRVNSYVWHIRGLTFDSAQEAADHFQVSDVTIHRWVKGGFDSRRNSFTPPRGDCRADPRY